MLNWMKVRFASLVNWGLGMKGERWAKLIVILGGWLGEVGVREGGRLTNQFRYILLTSSDPVQQMCLTRIEGMYFKHDPFLCIQGNPDVGQIL
jgi:hypothetical protein